MSTRAAIAAAMAGYLMCFPPCSQARAPETGRANSQDPLPANALKDSQSLYLREAAGEPIRWQPWNTETFALARRLERPMLVDVGAMWCHWCHVMDQTTYSDPEVARIVNQNFVPVKIDADQHPEIDAYYQSITAPMFGASGWPLTCFTTADGALFFAAGFMPARLAEKGANGERLAMVPLLERIAGVYAKDRVRLEKQALSLATSAATPFERFAPAPHGEDKLLDRIFDGLAASYSGKNGGFETGPGAQFYNFEAVRLALAHGFFGHAKSAAMAAGTLAKLGAGGVYDHLGGGFHRYATDPAWRVPHFEKMAYDQAMALRAYAEAYEATGDDKFDRLARSLVGYVNGALLDPQTHAFYSHQDADSFRGDDGSYYTWTRDEVRRVLAGSEATGALLYFGLESDPARAPNGRIVLRQAMTPAELAERLHLSEPRAQALIERSRVELLAARRKRPPPQVDTAILTDRNALMVGAYVKAGEALGDPKLEQVALDALDFLLTRGRAPDGGFYHVFAGGKSAASGLVADQVYTAAALIDAYEVSGNRKYLDAASSLATLVFDRYRDSRSGLLADHPPLPDGIVLARTSPSPDVFFDDPMPAVQAVAAETFYRLAALTSNDNYARRAARLLEPAPQILGAAAGPSEGALGLALEERAHGEAVVAVAGPIDSGRTQELLRAALGTYRPGKVVMRVSAAQAGDVRLPEAIRAIYAASARKNVPLAFVCAGTACATPVSTALALADTIRHFGLGAAQTGALAKRGSLAGRGALPGN